MIGILREDRTVKADKVPYNIQCVEWNIQSAVACESHQGLSLSHPPYICMLLAAYLAPIVFEYLT